METSPESSFRPFLQGRHLYLREVRPSDVNEAYYGWMNDPEVTRYLESRFFPNSIEALQKYIIKEAGERDTAFFAIVLNENHRHIGNIKLGPINWIHGFGDIGLIIGTKDCWGKGYATEAIRLVVEYGFNRLHLHKLTASSYDVNPGSIKAFLKAGFEIEGVRKQHFYLDGKYVDAVMMGMLRPEDGRFECVR